MGYIDVDLQEKFEFYSYGHALEILYDAFPVEWGEIQKCLRELRLTVADLKKSGGNESPIPKKFDNVLYPFGWREIRISGDLIVKSIHVKRRKEGDGLRISPMRRRRSRDTLMGITSTSSKIVWRSIWNGIARTKHSTAIFSRCEHILTVD